MFLLISSSILVASCKDALQEKKDYLDARIPMLKKNLTEKEFNQFLQIMEFDKNGNLNGMDFELLEKGTAEKHDSIQYRINADMVGIYGDITIVDSLGLEKLLTPDLVVYNTIDQKKVNIADFTKENTIYMITSVNCGPCVQFSKEANKIASDPANKDFQFVALFADPAIRMENYKKGTAYQRFGLLDEHWLRFNNEQKIIREIKQMYKGKPREFEIGEGFPELFYYKNGKFVRTEDAHQLQEIVDDLKKTLASNGPKSNY